MTGTVRGETPVHCSGISAALRVASMQRASARMAAGVPKTLYRVRYRTPDNRQTDKRGFVRKRDAEIFAASVEVQKLHGEYVSPSGARTTVGELGPAWLERKHGHLKPAGYAVMETTWRLRIRARWGQVSIGDIRPTAVQQ